MLKVGDQAPDFALPDQNGHIVRLADIKNKSNAVIFFYPKDETPGCTAESCSFRDNYAGFKAHNTQVIGISDDDAQSHDRFIKKHSLPFPLLSDVDGKVRKLYGVKNTFLIIPSRITFLIDRHGIVRHMVSGNLRIERHISETLEKAQTL